MKKILILLLIFNLGFCAWLYTLPTHDTQYNYLYNITFGVNFLIAAIASFRLTKICQVHRPIHVTLGIGSLLYFVAQLIWFIYNYLLIAEIPYPGLPDIFFMGFYFFVITGGILVMRQAIDVQFGLGKIIEIILTTGVIFLLMNSFIQSASIHQESLSLLTQILNYAYPALDALLVTLTLTAIRSRLGSLQPLLLYFMFAFIFLAFADTLFSYFTSIGTYWNGNYIDAIYATSGFFFAMGVIYLPNLLHADDNNFLQKNQMSQSQDPGTASLV